MTKFSIYIIALCFSVFLINQPVLAQEQNKPYKDKLIAIDNSLKDGDVSSALRTIEEILASYPNAHEVFYAKALISGQIRDINTAIQSAQSAHSLDPTNMVYSQYLLDLYKSKPDFEAALKLVDQLIAQHPSLLRFYNEKMLLYHTNKQSDQALKVYDIAIQKLGASDTLDVLKAEILVDLKRYSEAKSLLSLEVAKFSTLRQVYSTLAYVYLQEKDPKKAVEVLQSGISTTKDDLLYLDLADAYNGQKKYTLAFDAIKKAFNSDDVNYVDKHRVMLNVLNNTIFSADQKQELANELVLKYPRIADNHVFKADILWQKNQLSEARAVYLTAVGMHPNHVEAWRKLVNVEIGMNDFNSAIAHGQEAMAIIPNNAVLNYFTGLAYLLKKDTNQARHYFEQALNFSTNENKYVQSMIYGSLGDLYHELKMYAASDVAYEEAIALDDQNVTSLNNYAYYLSLRKKDLDKAAQYAKMANEVDKSSSTFQDTYAWVLFQQENYKEALIWIEKAVKNSKPSAVVIEHYGDILFKNGKLKDALKQWQRALELKDGDAAQKDKLKLKISEKKYID